MKQHLVLGALSVFIAAGAFAQEAKRVEDLPGYVPFDAKSIFGEGSSFEISLTAPLIRMMANATKEVEPELAELLAGLQLVRVHVAPFNVDSTESLVGNLTNVTKDLEAKGWERVMKMREHDGRAFMDAFMKMKDEKAEGFTLMVAEGSGEAVFINIVGLIDPEKLGSLAAKVIGDEFDASIFDEIALETGQKSPLDAARASLAEARSKAESAGLAEATVSAAESLSAQADKLAEQGHAESAAALFNAAADLYRSAAPKE